MSEAVTIQLIVTGGLVLVALIGFAGQIRVNKATAHKLNSIKGDVFATRLQAENEHAESDYPNLRDEITSIRLTVEQLADRVAADAETMARADERGTTFIQEVDTDVRSLRKSLDRHIVTANRQLDEIRASIPIQVSDGIREHVNACPLRQPPPPKP